MARAEEKMSVVTAMVRATFLVNAAYAASGREYGLTPQQGQLLCVLMPQPYGMSELGGMLGLAKSSLTGLVDRTAKLGLVRREADARGRAEGQQVRGGRRGPVGRLGCRAVDLGEDVGGGDVGVPHGVSGHLGLVEVGDVADGVDVGVAADGEGVGDVDLAA
ncbi:MAG TPA: MarR family transcriptional regulator, partial [Phytomonospora sp.]